jgi:poly(3-hydroxybutyrate) depolymerase
VPLVSLHGDKDGLVSYASGVTAVNGWIQRNGCTDTQPTQTYSKGVATCEAHTQCKGGTMVEFCTIKGGGHCWFGNPICPLGLSTTDISSNERMWELFKKYPMP